LPFPHQFGAAITAVQWGKVDVVSNLAREGKRRLMKAVSVGELEAAALTATQSNRANNIAPFQPYYNTGEFGLAHT
jgi:hypothetical protein